MNKTLVYRIDWIVIFCYLILVVFGLINIYSSTYDNETSSNLNFNSLIGKQIIYFLISICFGIFILGIRTRFFQQFSFTIYIISLLSLIGLFIFGQTVNGANSWYFFQGISVQPSEFAKIATTFMIAKHLSGFQTNIKNKKSLIMGVFIILLPVSLIIMQPDPGSAIIFCSFFLIFFREGLSFNYLILTFLAIGLFLVTLLAPINFIIYSIVLISLFFIFYLKKNNPKSKIFPTIVIGISSIVFILSVNFIFNSVFEQRHRDRFNIMLGIIEDTKGLGYNINQSKIAIGSGGLTGKGFLQGTQTKGNFVPEQQTDYIFSTVGEEWGFLGSFGLITVFVVLIIRMLNQAEKQTNIFRRTFIYGISSLIFTHFVINIGMSLGLLPSIGIPLPFISSGGSSLLTFSLLIFIYLNFDSNRLNDW
jgi:rod shape determining protein RodA